MCFKTLIEPSGDEQFGIDDGVLSSFIDMIGSWKSEGLLRMDTLIEPSGDEKFGIDDGVLSSFIDMIGSWKTECPLRMDVYSMEPLGIDS
ncbi:hypothetical protein CEXT_369641 [Caerostris extrusa]|uniref:Uncharacterized protein n=1 Tax=Caerostris extrusa TaxID=172846 RepID=A0AAV4XJ24_CAEEX|nr:hypothetical protein CEXT_369641 [Caerostris extrusa]